jgi:Kv channel-interacting protein
MNESCSHLIDFLFLYHFSFADCELEELEAPQRYRPDSLAQICKTTKFSEPEIKRMYRGFKSHCPNGMVKEDTFKIIYGQFFPQGGS